MSATGADPGNAATTPADGATATPNPATAAGASPQSGTKAIPAELMPVLDAKVEERLAAVRAAERARVLQEVKEQQDRDKLSEVDRLKSDLSNAQSWQPKAQRAERVAEVALAAVDLGGVPREYLTAAIDAAKDDATPTDIAKAAQERFQAHLKQFGGTPGPRPSAVPAGGATATGGDGVQGLSDEQIKKRALSGKKEDDEWYERVGKPELARRFMKAEGVSA